LKILRTHIARFITFLVALQILNMGLFVQDFQSLASSPVAIADHNIINSVVEYISEVVLNKVNSIPENNSKSNRDLQAHKHFIVKIIELKKPYILLPQFIAQAEIKFPRTESYYYQFCKEINPPPPKA
jgi:hypothetical protein